MQDSLVVNIVDYQPRRREFKSPSKHKYVLRVWSTRVPYPTELQNEYTDRILLVGESDGEEDDLPPAIMSKAKKGKMFKIYSHSYISESA